MHVVYRRVVLALLPNKKQQTYHRLIDKLSKICPSWDPKFMMMDFERSARNGFADKFTNPATMSSCFFHLQNSVHRKTRRRG